MDNHDASPHILWVIPAKRALRIRLRSAKSNPSRIMNTSIAISVAIVVGVNGLILLILLWLLPMVANLTGIFRTTAHAFTQWEQAAAAAFHPLPAALRQTAQSLRHSRQALTRSQKRLALLRTLWGALRFLRG